MRICHDKILDDPRMIHAMSSGITREELRIKSNVLPGLSFPRIIYEIIMDDRPFNLPIYGS
jgi:hypothetical protein